MLLLKQSPFIDPLIIVLLLSISAGCSSRLSQSNTATNISPNVDDAAPNSSRFQANTADVEIFGEANGLRWGTARLKESGSPWNLGTGWQSYSIASGQVGYFYRESGSSTITPVYFANVLQNSACDTTGNAQPGYQGFAAFAELTDVSKLNYSSTNSIQFGSARSGCYTGLLVFRQGDYYGVIEPLEMDEVGTLRMRWWIGQPSVVDFSRAPGKETIPVVTAPQSTLAPAPTTPYSRGGIVGGQ